MELTQEEELSDTVAMKMGRNAGNETFAYFQFPKKLSLR